MPQKYIPFLSTLTPDVRYLLYELAETNNISQNAQIEQMILNAAAEAGITVPPHLRAPRGKRNNLRKMYRPPAAPHEKSP